ncbi:SDR family NAD(P)-dependent oxidoreductase [Actinokineospora pegani]|uniref:SDR family NAD(P)-dependent oxidoreductase n=1 Tax=Actinokineospora pegani TaxID=2654637 RepID=UPI0012EA123B|nr:SDR family oxidoreductase [Actinokineospora pegani]
MSERFTGHTVVVTGAASGIGAATATALAAEGARVVGVDIAAVDLPGVEPLRADITDPDDIARVAEAAGSRVDGLANVAGIIDDFSPLHEVTDEVWRRVFAVNVDGMMRLTRALLPPMIAAGRGSVVNIASEAALRGSAAGVAYTAAKHAVVGLTRSTAFMYAPHGIRVNAVAPGGVATGMTAGGGSPSEAGLARISPFLATLPPIATPEQVAATITHLLSDESSNTTGVLLPCDGGWSVH